MASSFPIGSSILLQGLKAAEYNGKKSIVRSALKDGRQEVYVFDGVNKSMRIKTHNMEYEPREASSLSLSDLKGALAESGLPDEQIQGADKSDLVKLVESVASSPEDIAKLVAKANEPKEAPPPSCKKTGTPGLTTSQLRDGAQKMAQMNPDQLKQQAATMRQMGPQALRSMNPQMAMMSDAQINQALEQMEQVANNPAMMRAATEQMKNISDSELQQTVGQNMGGGMPTSDVKPPMQNMSASQFQQATNNLTSNPEMLKTQAAAMKGMSMDELRLRQPQFNSMSDDQIRAAIAQMEMIAANPGMMNMVKQQMENMTPEQFEQMKGMVNSGAVPGMADMISPSATSNGNDGTAALPANMAANMDPSQMMQGLMTNPEQLNSTVKMLKSNPDMIKSFLASQAGGDDAKVKQFEKALDSFVQMDDGQIDKYLKRINTVQGIAKPFVTVFDKLKSTLGVSAKMLIVMLNLMFIGFVIMLGMWWKNRSGGDDVTIESVLEQDEPPEIISNYDSNSEF